MLANSLLKIQNIVIQFGGHLLKCLKFDDNWAIAQVIVAPEWEIVGTATLQCDYINLISSVFRPAGGSGT